MEYPFQKKILFVVNYLSGGGVERMLVNMVKCLYKAFNVHVLTIYDINSYYRDEIKQLVKVHTLDSFRKRLNHTPLISLYSRWFDNISTQRMCFKHFIKSHRYNVVVAFSEGIAFKLVAQASLPGTKKIVWTHTDYLNSDNWVKKNKNELATLFARFDDAVFVCETLRQKFTKILNLQSTRTIANGVEIEKIQSMAEASIQKIQFDGVNIVSIGRLSHEKGHDRLINALSFLDSTERQKCHLTIIGGGSMEGELREMVKTNGLQSVVTFVGSVNNPYPFIKNADALFLASKYEGFGLVLIEAMALGTPVVATKTTGAVSVTENGKYGTLIDNNQESINAILKSLINDINQLSKYKANLIEHASIYSLSNFKRVVIDYFKNE